MTNRRTFLLGLGTALAAPAVVRASSLMKIWVPPKPKLSYLQPVVYMKSRMFFVVNNGPEPFFISAPFNAWRGSVQPGEKKVIQL